MSHTLDAPRETTGTGSAGLVPSHAGALLLAPSRGLGGGIERFVSTIEAAFQQERVLYRRLDLLDPYQPNGFRTKLSFVLKVTRAVLADRRPVRLVIAHPNLLPIVRIVGRFPNFTGATVLAHGCEVWTELGVPARRIMCRPDVRVVTSSNFTAGSMAATCHAKVLNPGLSRDWYQTLVNAAARTRPTAGRLSLVTAFRLADWRDKGLGTLLDALQLLGDDRIQLTVCGSGLVSPELRAKVAPHPWCRIVAGVSDQALAEHLAAADLFVLATRTRFGAGARGEGYGLVLLEAQIAGTPVIVPAYGGSNEAFQPGLTGLSPLDESPHALASVLASLLEDSRRRAEMGRAAAAWSRARFEPSAYSKHVVHTLLADLTDHRGSHRGGSKS